MVVRSISMEKMHPGCSFSCPVVSWVSLDRLTAKGDFSLKAVTVADLLTTFHPFMLKSRKAFESARLSQFLVLPCSKSWE